MVVIGEHPGRCQGLIAEVVVLVEDDGVGIPADQVDVVFDRFHDAAHSTGPAWGSRSARSSAS